MATTSLVTITLENNDASSKDQTKFSLVVTGSAQISAATLTNIWEGFFDNAGAPTHRLGTYLATCINLAAGGQCAAYDITAHLDGSPHGSPYVTSSAAMNPSLGDSRGNQLCAVFAFNDSLYAGTPAAGPSGAIPTPEFAQDMGAPATHTGTTRPKSRHTNRMYFGPLDAGAIGVDGNADPQFTDTFMADAAGSLAHFLATVASLPTSPVWSVWSRRNAAVTPVNQGWVDRGIKTRRHKAFVPNLRTNFP
jgi:hypothetical protein